MSTPPNNRGQGPAGNPASSGNPDLDSMLAEWGARLFYTPIRGKSAKDGVNIPLAALTMQARAAMVRSNVRAVVGQRATPVVVKITGGGKGMKAIAAHFRYIGRQGSPEAGGRGRTLELEDELGNKLEGRAALEQLADDWRLSGTYIPDQSGRKEAFNIIFSMPPGTPADPLREAVADTARDLFAGHRYVFALHEDQGAPHVHLAVRAEHRDGHRLNPRKADLERWRQTFASRLQDRGIQATATRQATRLRNHSDPSLWEKQAAAAGRLRRQRSSQRGSAKALSARADALKAWGEITKTLARSADPADRALAQDAMRYLAEFAPGGERAARLAAEQMRKRDAARRSVEIGHEPEHSGPRRGWRSPGR